MTHPCPPGTWYFALERQADGPTRFVMIEATTGQRIYEDLDPDNIDPGRRETLDCPAGRWILWGFLALVAGLLLACLGMVILGGWRGGAL